MIYRSTNSDATQLDTNYLFNVHMIIKSEEVQQLLLNVSLQKCNVMTKYM